MPAPSDRPALPPLLQKACPIVTRRGAAGAEILVYVHPRDGLHLVRGIVPPGGDVAAAALRELRRASGLAARQGHGAVRIVEPVPAERWHLVPCEAPGAPEQWIHAAPGPEGGELLRFRWRPLAAPPPEDADAPVREVLAACATAGA